jgi:hypothetical protein
VIRPQKDAHRHSPDDYEKSFIVVARLENSNGAAIPRYALPGNGASFWVVFKVDSAWWSYFIADDDDDISLDVVEQIDYYASSGEDWKRWKQSIAQWVWDDDPHISAAGIPMLQDKGGGTALAKEVPWITCTPFGCCKGR